MTLNQDQDSVAAWIAETLVRCGADRIFALEGGHIQPIWDHVAKLGICIIDVPTDVLRSQGVGSTHS